MTKKELKTGDIIVTKSGWLGVVLKEDEYILYQRFGIDWLDDFNDDLTYADEDCDEAIMEIYRGCSFIDIDETLPEWQRDKNWIRPTEKEIREKEKAAEQARQQYLEELRTHTAKVKKDSISIVAQYFYGNRTGTEVSRDHIDHFLRGCLGEYHLTDVTDVVRNAVIVPGTDNVVIVYDQTQEDRYVNEEFLRIYAEEGTEYLERWGEELKMHISCEIPEINFRIHTRCFACRMDEYGNLQSLEDNDIEKFIHYFPTK